MGQILPFPEEMWQRLVERLVVFSIQYIWPFQGGVYDSVIAKQKGGAAKIVQIFREQFWEGG